MSAIAMHFTKGFATVFGIQTQALQCKHCKETLLFNDSNNTAKTAMKRHIAEEHPILNRIYN